MTHLIWTISTIGLHSDRRVHARTWGYYPTKHEAMIGMHQHVDTEAGYYTHVVIEPFQPGIYAFCEQRDQTWFENLDGKGWKPCERPKSETGTINYGMG